MLGTLDFKGFQDFWHPTTFLRAQPWCLIIMYGAVQKSFPKSLWKSGKLETVWCEDVVADINLQTADYKLEMAISFTQHTVCQSCFQVPVLELSFICS